MEPVDIHGFISQGYIRSIGNDVMTDTTQGSFEMNEMGLTFTTQVDPRLRLGIQFFARDYGEYGNDEVTVDWAFADYKVRPWLGLKAGSMKIASGFYNTSRDIDSARTFVILPSLYMESFRELFVGIKGLGVYGYLPYGLSYIASAGIGGNEEEFEDSFLFGTLFPVIFRGFASQISGMPPDAFTNIHPISIREKCALNLGLVWNTPLTGLRFSATYFGTRLEADMAFDIGGNTYAQEIVLEETATIIYSAEYAAGDTTVAAEYMIAPFYVEDQPKRKMESYYASIAHRFSERFELGIYYSELYPHYDDKDGSQQREGLPFHYSWFKDFCYTLRFDLSYNWIFKMEGHVIDGVALNPATYKVRDFEDTSRRWEVYLAKLSYNF
ncbi:MAG: hypothetical protein KJ737_21315 [Proteobacteria bacterium]|nr:hypothetical protein [Pseudomonadota bacterium]